MGIDPREYLLSLLEKRARLRDRPWPVAETENLIELGVIDSLGFLDIIALVEVKFDLRIDFSGKDPGEFLTISGILNLIREARRP